MDPILSDMLLSYFLNAIISVVFYLIVPVLVIPALGEKARRRFGLIVWLNFVVLYLISYAIFFFFFVDFLDIIIFPLIFTSIAHASLKKQFSSNDNSQPPAESLGGK